MLDILTHPFFIGIYIGLIGLFGCGYWYNACQKIRLYSFALTLHDILEEKHFLENHENLLEGLCSWEKYDRAIRDIKFKTERFGLWDDDLKEIKNDMLVILTPSGRNIVEPMINKKPFKINWSSPKKRKIHKLEKEKACH